MNVRPIIFSPAMVRALLCGRKTQTRRLAWRDKGHWYPDGEDIPTGRRLVREADGLRAFRPTSWQSLRPGDVLYVRENFAYVGGSDPGILLFAADWQARAAELGLENVDTEPKWTPCIHMPRAISRLTLEVLDTKIEQVKQIGNEDARAEGVDFWPDSVGRRDPFPATRFRDLWASLHGMNSWDANPEVVALTLKIWHENVDRSHLTVSA